MTIAKSLLDYISIQFKFQVSQKTLNSKKEYFEIAKHRYTMGLLSAQDLDKVMIDLNNADSNQHDLEIEIEKIKSDLKIQLSQNLNLESISIQWPWIDRLNSLNTKSNPTESELSNDFSVENHPEWQQQNEILNSAKAASQARQADLFPRVDLTLSTEKFHYIDQDWTHQWSGVIALEIPLFNKMSDYSSYKVSVEQKLQDSIKLELLAKNLKETFNLSNRTLKATIKSALNREKTQKIAEKLYNDNLVRFKTGRTTVNDLLLDQERLTQTQYLAIQGWLEAHTSLLKYCQAQGFEQLRCFNKL
jgi:outer membrane protein TolC